jgi:hypothetical protein
MRGKLSLTSTTNDDDSGRSGHLYVCKKNVENKNNNEKVKDGERGDQKMGKENLKYEGEKWRWREVGRIRGRDDSEADSTLAVIRPRHRLYGNCGYSGPALLKSDRGRLVVWS